MSSGGRVALLVLAALSAGAGRASLAASPSAPLAVSDPAAGAPAARPSATPRRTPVASDIESLRKGAVEEEAAARKRLHAIGKEARIAEARLVARGRAYVALARVGLLPVGGGVDALIDHAARLERLHHGLEEDIELGRRLAAERLALAKRLDELSARRSTLDTEYAVLSRAADVLRSAEEREQAFAQAFARDHHTAIHGAVGPVDPALSPAGFSALKGRLPFPIAGRTEILPARRASSTGPGLEMRAPAGTVVRSVAAGRVSFADTYADYGKTVILDHGRRHYTVSANLGSIDVEVGTELDPGARIGTVGDTGSGPRLYFEIRVERDTLDPSAWFGI
jgi:murein DD-endopeptidase MepM/ murein hydrolase activator NlpD